MYPRSQSDNNILNASFSYHFNDDISDIVSQLSNTLLFDYQSISRFYEDVKSALLPQPPCENEKKKFPKYDKKRKVEHFEDMDLLTKKLRVLNTDDTKNNH